MSPSSALHPVAILLLLAAAGFSANPTTAAVREFGSWFVRPARLPFAWQALTEATRSGDAREAFARGRQILQLLPGWTGGHAAIAFRYALTHDTSTDPERRAADAEHRLQVALAYLEAARADAGRRELDLLQSASLLPRVACNQFPGLAARLAPRGGAAAISDAFLHEAARLYPTAAVREQRLWFTPTLAAALLLSGDRQQAIAVLAAALPMVPEVRDRQLAEEWGHRLQEVLAWLHGDRSVDLTAVFADPRFEPLWVHLR